MATEDLERGVCVCWREMDKGGHAEVSLSALEAEHLRERRHAEDTAAAAAAAAVAP